jgi:hypothetical protein
MKAKVIIEDGVTTIKLTPETIFEEKMIENTSDTLAIGSKEITTNVENVSKNHWEKLYRISLTIRKKPIDPERFTK